MKKRYFLPVFLFALCGVAQAQQKKKEAPKVNLEQYQPPAKQTTRAGKAPKKNPKKDIPKVDLTNFKPPVMKTPDKKKN